MSCFAPMCIALLVRVALWRSSMFVDLRCAFAVMPEPDEFSVDLERLVLLCDALRCLFV